ncbi:ATP-binding cassette domain-containing protein [Acinetobacter vivianii]|uniref:ABC transporter ATP-binding protein n=1 Tax=Acinetobacter vivianii TaxID=1776742 RepID=UPI002DBE4A69|nr:ATP-binding cassette domain-containing protein [Acinetobacter vivianii]MEB6665699.1 ATP-binding cassette domain-containing protein [Acinetobacter vivianii]
MKQYSPNNFSTQSASSLVSGLSNFIHADKRKKVLEVIDVQKSFQKYQVLDHINFEVYEGEFISLLGPSGCGKTTLLRIIAGLEVQDYGKVLKMEQDISNQKVEKRRCGIVFQNYALFPNLTVAENITFGLHAKQWNKAERQQRTEELLQLIELPTIATKYPNQLSGGQQQRVALARAIAPRPDILLLDEPLSALDAIVRVNLRQKIRVIQQQLGLPTVMVTHDQEEALSISDRVVVMNHGVIEQVDTPHNIYYKPQTKFVAQFIGTMNFLPAQVSDSNTIQVFGQSLQLKTSSLQAGQQIELAFRPEMVAVCEQADHDPAFIYLPVSIISTEFLGAKRRLFTQVNVEQNNAAHVIQLDLDNDALAILNPNMYIKVAIKQLHVFDGKGRTLC